jgi:anti-sigma B factor antagonist
VHSVAIQEEGSAAVVVVGSGELDAFAAPALSSELDAVRGRGGVVVDLSRVSFMDSTILGLVVRATRELDEAGTQVRIVLPSGPARRIFEITALDTVLPVADTRGSALRDLGV